MPGVSQRELWLTFTLLGSSKLSEVTKALNQDLQLGPGEPNWATFVMECRGSQCSLSRSTESSAVCSADVLWRQQKCDRKAKSSFLFCPCSLKDVVAQQWFTPLSSSRGHVQLVRNAWVWSQVDRFSSCPTSPFCSRREILESRDHHNGALSHRAGKLDLCSERTDSCWRGFHNATIYIRKWTECFLKKNYEEEEGKKPSSVFLAQGRDQLWFHDIRGWNAEGGKCIAVCMHVFEFLYPMHNIQS